MKILNLTTCFLILALLSGCGKEQVDNRSELFIKSKPDGAIVFMNNKECGVTPIRMKVPPATYIFELRKSDFSPAFRKLICEEKESVTLDVSLEPVTSSVMITSTPPGASIEIEDKKIGETPIILHAQGVGVHKASVKKPGYVEQEISWSVEDARPQQVKVTMGTNLGTLKIESDPTGANILIDGKVIGRTPLSEKFEQAEYMIKVEKQGHTSYEQKIFVEKDVEKNIVAKLNILPGSLKIVSSPPGAACRVNDEIVKNTPLEMKDLQPGQYKLSFEKEGYDSVERTVSVLAGRETEVAVTLDTNLGGIDIMVNPPGVTIYLDGKKMGVSEPDPVQPGISKIFELRGLTSGSHTIKLAHSRSSPEEKSVSVTVKKGQISRPKQITMWIADTYLKLKNGKVMHGRLRQENENEIIFEPEPNIAQRFGRDEIEAIRKLREKE